MEKQRWAVDTAYQSFVPENVTWVHKLYWTILMLLWNKLGQNFKFYELFACSTFVLYQPLTFLWQAKASIIEWILFLPCVLCTEMLQAERKRWVHMPAAETWRNPAFCHTTHFCVLYDAHKNSDAVLNSMNPSAFILNTISVLCEVGTEFLCHLHERHGQLDRATGQAVGLRHLTKQKRFRSRAGPSEIYGGQSGTRTDFLRVLLNQVCRVLTLRGLSVVQRC
jgi:hypothetical protein